jgi:hypothetical protein
MKSVLHPSPLPTQRIEKTPYEWKIQADSDYKTIPSHSDHFTSSFTPELFMKRPMTPSMAPAYFGPKISLSYLLTSELSELSQLARSLN